LITIIKISVYFTTLFYKQILFDRIEQVYSIESIASIILLKSIYIFTYLAKIFYMLYMYYMHFFCGAQKVCRESLHEQKIYTKKYY